MLRHLRFCLFPDFCLFPNAAALGLQCCGIEATASFNFSSNAAALGNQCCSIHSFSSILSLFASFLSSFHSNARTITYNIKYHINVSKMIIILTKLLSMRPSNTLNFTPINSLSRFRSIPNMHYFSTTMIVFSLNKHVI